MPWTQSPGMSNSGKACRNESLCSTPWPCFPCTCPLAVLVLFSITGIFLTLLADMMFWLPPSSIFLLSPGFSLSTFLLHHCSLYTAKGGTYSQLDCNLGNSAQSGTLEEVYVVRCPETLTSTAFQFSGRRPLDRPTPPPAAPLQAGGQGDVL